MRHSINDLIKVAPLAGAWIEIIASESCKEILQSLPSRERGLKYTLSRVTSRDLSSLPSRERGLKLSHLRRYEDLDTVAPLAGAGIEIAKRSVRVPGLQSRSPRGSVD